MGWWDGHIDNQSSKEVWGLVDDHGGGAVDAKKVKSKTKTPGNIDVDAVKAVDAIVTIDTHNSWWRLARGNSVTITDDPRNPNNLLISGAVYGKLEKKVESDWGTPGGNIKYGGYF